jgi:hypothetical protein
MVQLIVTDAPDDIVRLASYTVAFNVFSSGTWQGWCASWPGWQGPLTPRLFRQIVGRIERLAWHPT